MDNDISPEQCRAARAWLGWSRWDLAERARTSDQTVMRFELRYSATRPEIRGKIRQTLEGAGVRFDGNDLVLPWTRAAGV